MNPEDVKKTVKEEVHDLIREHQRLPGSILRGIMQRYVFSVGFENFIKFLLS